ncbi:MAG: hypothetical protein HY749_02385 [Gammaproteobacteria bacterium]|nr:hypothetical protein [Gammaproteobacteria bacterium]MBI5615536.1 hypothetical protein [Gammaproteobacteria bacterium]
MTLFEELLTAPGEDLLKILLKAAARIRNPSEPNRPARDIAKALGLTHAQLVCACGFNPAIRELPDVLEILGFPGYDALAQTRNRYFTTDIYDRLGIKDVLAVYLHVPKDMKLLQVMQYLLGTRLQHIEERIEATVNSLIIERYKKEMRSIYNDGAAQIEFAEERLANTHSGFRALLNEVTMIVESRLIPIGDIFFRDNILPEEKRRLIIKRLIPRALVQTRLKDPGISNQERKMLEEQLLLIEQ